MSGILSGIVAYEYHKALFVAYEVNKTVAWAVVVNVSQSKALLLFKIKRLLVSVLLTNNINHDNWCFSPMTPMQGADVCNCESSDFIEKRSVSSLATICPNHI